MRTEAIQLAHKLLGLGLEQGDRVALVAETNPDFIRFFYACQYAGLIPVALPASVKVGAHCAYVAQLHLLLQASDAAIGVASEGYLPFLQEASEGLDIRMVERLTYFTHCPSHNRNCRSSSPKVFPIFSTPPAVHAFPGAW